MTKGTMFLETTTIAATKSIGEITAELVKAGAAQINTMYENGRPSGLSWSQVIYGRPVFFSMPAKTEPVYKWLRSRTKGFIARDREAKMREQAERVAWRQMLMWVKVQMVLIDIGMVEYAQVFLPYVTDTSGRTWWEAARDSHFKQLEAPKQ